MPDAPIPRLRHDLSLETSDDGSEALVDRRFERRVRLDATAAAIVRLLDGERTPEQVQRELQQDGIHLAASLFDRALAFLDEHLLLENERSRVATEAPSMSSNEVVLRNDIDQLEVFFLDEARHNCVGCGMCCRAYDLGPLSEDEVAQVESLEIKKESSRIARTERVATKTISGREVKVLNTVGEGQCVFLGEDNHCIVHEEHGSEAKPSFCQLFPVRFVASPDGKLFGSLRMECYSYHEASRHGPYLAENTKRVDHLVKIGRLFPTMDTAVDIAHRAMGLDEYYALEHEILEFFATKEFSPLQAFKKSANRLATIADLDGNLGSNFEPRLEHLIGALGEVETATRPTYVNEPTYGNSLALQSLFVDATSRLLETGDIDFGSTSDLKGDALAILRETHRNSIFAKEWYRLGDLRWGLVFNLIRQVITISAAKILSQRWSEDGISPKAITHAIVTVHRRIPFAVAEEIVEKNSELFDELFASFLNYESSDS